MIEIHDERAGDIAVIHAVPAGHYHRPLLSPAAFAARTAVLAEYELEGRLETIAGRPLLLWHGETDDVVPAADSLRLAAELRRQGAGSRLTSLVEPGVKHRITPLALSATADFFRREL
ncbi:TPA: prolyl oligopeptidase family serine peptidase [Serratia marcescens]|nr:prolyl oligopeptidase family serine peptidase [Serratia marcescens]